MIIKLKNKFIVLTTLLAIFTLFAPPALAQNKAESTPTTATPLPVYFFFDRSCSHCAAENTFLSKLEGEYGEKISVHRLEAAHDQKNAELLRAVAKKHQVEIKGLPATFIGEEEIIGYVSYEITGVKIKEAIDQCLTYGCECPAEEILVKACPEADAPIQEPPPAPTPIKIKIPFAGQMDITKMSLPLLTFMIGILDGFNPCAMWVLLFLITLLLGTKSRKRMWLLGSAFILGSGIVYFLFMAAWLNFFLFIGYIQWTRIIIGLAAIGMGLYNLREFQKNKAGECKVTKKESRKKVFDKIRQIIETRQLWLALSGILILAFVVNLVELACSAGFPAIYTQVLSLNHLPSWQYYAYLLFYIFFFMLDDMIVFAIAMATLRAVGLSGKYSRYSTLIGGIIILLLGLLLILKPEWLMFG